MNMYPDKIYICHYDKLVDRREKLENSLKDIYDKVDIEWITKFQPEDIEDDYNEMLENFKQIDTTYRIYHPYGHYESKYNKINIGNYSLILKHKYIFEKSLKDNVNIFLILEDDVKIDNNFDFYLQQNTKEFKRYVEEIGVDILTMGTSHGREYKNPVPGKYVYYDTLQKTRCTHALMYNINSIKKILKYFDVINNPIDFKLDEIMMREKLKVCWSYPGLLQDNSFKSTIQV